MFVRALDSFTTTRDEAHPVCFACAPRNPSGLRLTFLPQADGAVAAAFDCDCRYEGYRGIIHGGIVSTLLDAAMTNCLFNLGYVAVTGDLHVRFRHSVCSGQHALVSACVTRVSSPLFVLEAKIIQRGQIKATAVGKFVRLNAPVAGEMP